MFLGKIEIIISEQKLTNFPFDFQIVETDSQPQFLIHSCSFDPHKLDASQQHLLKEKVFELFAHLIARAFAMKDYEKSLERLFRDQRIFDRATFTGSFVTLGNILGDSPSNLVRQWLTGESRRYALKRDKIWDADVKEKIPKSEVTQCFQQQKTAGQHAHEQDVNHKYIFNLSLINVEFWDKAKWTGTCYFGTHDHILPPGMALIFRNRDAAAKIFSDWLKRFGKEDVDEAIMLTIIRGIDRANPYAYRIAIGSNPKNFNPANSQPSHIVMASRMKVMEPQDNLNLDTFLSGYKKHGSFFLTYAIMDAVNGSPLPADAENMIKKKHLTVRDAWTIGENDVACMCIHPDDDPIIPPNEPNAPVLKLIEWLKKQ